MSKAKTLTSDFINGLNKKFKIIVDDDSVIVYKIGAKYATKYKFGETIKCTYDGTYISISKKEFDFWYPEFETVCTLFDIHYFVNMLKLNNRAANIDNIRWLVNSGYKEKTNMV